MAIYPVAHPSSCGAVACSRCVVPYSEPAMTVAPLLQVPPSLLDANIAEQLQQGQGGTIPLGAGPETDMIAITRSSR